MVEAISKGLGVEKIIISGIRSGRVHSCFRTSLNISVSNEQLITLTTKKDRHYLAVNLPADSLLPSPAIGTPVTLDSKFLAIHGHETVLMKNCPLWSAGEYACTAGTAINAPIIEVAEFVSGLGHIDGFGGLLEVLIKKPTPPFGSYIMERALMGIRDLLTGLSRSDANLARLGAASLAGLGPGLTPSGDDFIAGVLSSWWWVKWRNDQAEEENECLKAVLEEVEKSSNVFGFQEAACAAIGELPESGVRFLISLIECKESWKDNIYPLLQIGSTSGIDILTGICFGLNAAAGNDIWQGI